MTRRAMEESVRCLEVLARQLMRNKATLLSVGSAAEYARSAAYLQRAQAVLTERIKALPVGVRYSGVFFIRRPFSSPSEIVRIEGSAFMAEDLNTSVIENHPCSPKDYHHGQIFKDPALRIPIGRGEATLVYDPSLALR